MSLTNPPSNGHADPPHPTAGNPVTPTTPDPLARHQAAADLIRGQIDFIYQGHSGQDTPHTTPVAPSTATPTGLTQAAPTVPSTPAPPNTPPQPAPVPNQPHALATRPTTTIAPTHQPTSHPVDAAPDPLPLPHATPEEWQQYHSAWQKYYQLYYERYYAHHLANRRATEAPATTTADDSTEPAGISEKAAMRELRAKIRQTVANSTKKVKSWRYFVPTMAGLATLALFLFIQFNSTLIGFAYYYTTPGNIDPQSIIASSHLDVKVSPEPRMIIPKINVDGPMIYGYQPDNLMKAMENGIAHFSIPRANAVPGQVGNAVFAAHSSNDAFAPGEYKTIFARNEKLVKDDIIYIHYQGTRYTYKITSMEVVQKTEVSKVQINTKKPMITLISCVPLGTDHKRLLIFAEQISPDPGKATLATPAGGSSAPSQEIPGNRAPTLIERLFGAG